ncbi:MAG: hypothetical protein HY096_00380 [Nitrospinae bacterium]|nr:hypothetical protein [Nitrospinota bacterium]
MKLTDIKPAGYNPRIITDEQLERLKKSLQKFGDLSGIVFNRRTGNLVGGHQRLKCLPLDVKIEKKDLKEKSKTGTVAQGFIILDGERYTYREVDWDEATEKMANIAANKHGGEWDDEKLGELLKELSEMPIFDSDLIGFEMNELNNILSSLNQELTGTAEQKYKPIFEVVVTCKNETEQKKIYKLLQERKYICRVLTL